MTDIEVTRLCAEAMDYKIVKTNWYSPASGEALWIDEIQQTYRPLSDDTQAMALVKKFKLDITHAWKGDDVVYKVRGTIAGWEVEPHPGDLNRAICECVAKMQSFRHSPQPRVRQDDSPTKGD